MNKISSALVSILLLAPRLAAAADTLPPVLDVNAMDRSADPCVDFFQYSCGTWLKENPVPADQSKWFRFSQLDEYTRALLRAMLAQAAVEKNQASPEARKIGDFYAACMDEPGIETKGMKPLQPELDRIAALKDKEELPAALARLHQIGGNAGFSFGSVQDYTDAENMIADADQGGWALPDRDYYLLDDYKDDRAAYLKHLQKMFGLLGEAKDKAAADAAVVLKLETALAKASMGRVERREPANVHHLMSRQQLQALTPSLSWDAYLQASGAPAFKMLDVSDPDFYKGLEYALTDFSLEDWKTYLRWTALHALASGLPKAVVQEDFEFFGKRLGGQQELKARWKRCVSEADGALGEALGKVYVQTEFTPAAKQRVVRLVRDIEEQMAEDLKGLPWMSPATKKRAKEKLDHIADKIGYPDKWRDYSRLAISPDDHLGNLARAEAFEVKRQLDKIGKKVDRGEWSMTPPTDNAYYDPQMNDINFPAGILQPPNFDLKADTAALLGALGATVGHELTHGFDDEGRHYDARGNLKDWWTEQDSKGFDERAQGFVDEYDKFVTVADPKDPKKSVRLNGKLTLGENIADNGGLLLAYLALEKALGPEMGKARDGFTPEQRFFISYGQSWCANETEAARRKAAKVDPHSTGKFRVNGVVVNMPQFATAFSCKAGMPMAPEKRNRVW